MSDDPNDSFRRFARDLRRVREDREVSLSTVQEATQVHQSHLESFESGTLYEESRMNDIYLKAFVRAYAEAVGLSPEPVIDHLEAALEGEYDDQLLQAFLQRPSEGDGSEGSASDVDEADRDPEESSVPPPVPESLQEDLGDGDETSTDEASDVPAEGQPESSDRDGGEPGAESANIPSEMDDLPERTPPTQLGADKGADAQSQPEPARDTSGSERSGAPPGPPSDSGASSVSQFRSGPLVAGGLLLLLLVGGGVGLYMMGNGAASDSTAGSAGSGDARAGASSAPPPDTTATDTAAVDRTPERPPLATVSLGDTLYAAVLATADVLEVRVQQDAKLRRPYWIEEGEAMVFPFTDRITLQNQLDNFQLLLEGYPYPTARTDDDGRVVISRDTAQQFADTLRGEPTPIPASPDTAWGDAPDVESDTLETDTLSTSNLLRLPLGLHTVRPGDPLRPSTHSVVHR